MENHRGALEELNLKIDLLLEAVNRGRMASQNGHVRHEDWMNTEHSGVSRGMQLHSIKLDFSRFGWEESN